MEKSRILHNSFAIAGGILGVTILVLLPITDYSNIPKELYITSLSGEKYFYFEMNMHMLRSDYK